MVQINAPSVTIVIPVRNGEDYLETAVLSALRQSISNFKLLISDNGSTDSTPEIIARYEGDTRIEVIRQTEPLSMLEHFNRCLDLVGSEYYMILCHDDALAAPTAIEEALGIAKAFPDISAIYCDLQYIDQFSRHISYRRFSRRGDVDSRAVGRHAVVSMRNQFGIPLLVRTSLRAAHRYNTKLPYAADVEMSLFLGSVGRTYHIPVAHIANRYHASNSTRGLMKNTRHEMRSIALAYSLPLDPLTRCRMYVNSIGVAIAKAAFFRMLSMKDVLRRG